MKRSNSGASLLFFAIILVGVMTVLIALLAMFRSSTSAASASQTVTQLEAAKAALEQFVSAAGRLPCPADPTLNTGVEAPAGGAATCTFPGGTLPWSTIGIRREDALDAWGFKISYRVYTGNNGSLTQPGGASMVNCDTVEPAPGGRTALVVNVGGLCAGDPADPTTFNTTEAQFLAGKGLAVNDFGNNIADAAFVLVSHGPSGRGAFTGSGTATDPPGNVNEINNMAAAGPFVAAAPATANMTPENANYFDDVIAYERLPDLIRRAKLNGRDWPEPPPPPVVANYTLDNATVAAALGVGSVSAGSLGTQTLNLGNATLTSSGVRDLSFDTSGTTDSVGVAGGGNLISSSAGEFVRIAFISKAQQLGITLRSLGTFINSGTTYTERVQLTFFDAGNPVGSPVIESGCRAQNSGDGTASFAINFGIDFDMVEVKPIVATPTAGNQRTSLGLAAFKACTALEPACASALATVANNCP